MMRQVFCKVLLLAMILGLALTGCSGNQTPDRLTRHVVTWSGAAVTATVNGVTVTSDTNIAEGSDVVFSWATLDTDYTMEIVVNLGTPERIPHTTNTWTLFNVTGTTSIIFTIMAPARYAVSWTGEGVSATVDGVPVTSPADVIAGRSVVFSWAELPLGKSMQIVVNTDAPVIVHTETSWTLENVSAESAVTFEIIQLQLLDAPANIRSYDQDIVWDAVTAALSYRVYVLRPGTAAPVYVSTVTSALISKSKFEFDGGQYQIRVRALADGFVPSEFAERTFTVIVQRPTAPFDFEIELLWGSYALFWEFIAAELDYISESEVYVNRTLYQDYVFLSRGPGSQVSLYTLAFHGGTNSVRVRFLAKNEGFSYEDGVITKIANSDWGFFTHEVDRHIQPPAWPEWGSPLWNWQLSWLNRPLSQGTNVFVERNGQDVLAATIDGIGNWIDTRSLELVEGANRVRLQAIADQSRNFLDSVLSDYYTITMLAPLPVVQNLRVEGNMLLWNGVPGSWHYDVYWRLPGQTEYSHNLALWDPEMLFNELFALAGEFSFRVRAAHPANARSEFAFLTHHAVPATQLETPVLIDVDMDWVSWNTVPLATHYEVEIRREGGTWELIHTMTPPQWGFPAFDPFRDLSLNGGEHRLRLRATAPTLPPSDWVEFDVHIYLAAPSNLHMHPTAEHPTINWFWNVPFNQNFRVYVNHANLSAPRFVRGTYNFANIPVAYLNLTNYGEYTIMVQATRTDGRIEPSGFGTLVVNRQRLAVPTGLSVDTATKTISWNEVPNATHYTMDIGAFFHVVTGNNFDFSSMPLLEGPQRVRIRANARVVPADNEIWVESAFTDVLWFTQPETVRLAALNNFRFGAPGPQMTHLFFDPVPFRGAATVYQRIQGEWREPVVIETENHLHNIRSSMLDWGVGTHYIRMVAHTSREVAQNPDHLDRALSSLPVYVRIIIEPPGNNLFDVSAVYPVPPPGP